MLTECSRLAIVKKGGATKGGAFESWPLKDGWIYEDKTASHLPNLRQPVLWSDGILPGLHGSDGYR